HWDSELACRLQTVLSRWNNKRSTCRWRIAPRAGVREVRPSDALALRPRRREPAARRPTLRVTISQRRWPPPLRPPQWRVLGFPDQAGRAAQPLIAEPEHGHWLFAEVDGCELKGRFVGHTSFPLLRGTMGWHDRGGVAPVAPSFAAFIARPLQAP